MKPAGDPPAIRRCSSEEQSAPKIGGRSQVRVLASGISSMRSHTVKTSPCAKGHGADTPERRGYTREYASGKARVCTPPGRLANDCGRFESYPPSPARKGKRFPCGGRGKRIKGLSNRRKGGGCHEVATLTHLSPNSEL